MTRKMLAAALVAAARLGAWALHLPTDEWSDLSDD